MVATLQNFPFATELSEANSPSALRSTLLPIGAVCAATTLTRGPLYAAIKKGEFPPPVAVSARRVAWRSNDIEAWIDSRPVKAASIETGGAQ